MDSAELTGRRNMLDEMLSIQGVLKTLPNVTSFSRLTSIVERKEIAGLIPLEDIKEMIETKLQERYNYLTQQV